MLAVLGPSAARKEAITMIDKTALDIWRIIRARPSARVALDHRTVPLVAAFRRLEADACVVLLPDVVTGSANVGGGEGREEGKKS